MRFVGTAEVWTRFWSKVEIPVDVGACWLWKAHVDSATGYGRVRYNGKTQGAHRVAYEMMVGPIPDGLTIDHVKARGCKHRHCVNPAHMEVVTNEVNASRAERWQLRRASCPSGHPYAGANLRIDAHGGRHCRTCDRTSAAASYAAKKETSRV